jgi:hypothetical protein
MGLTLIPDWILMPQFVKRRGLGELLEATADAFDTPAPILEGLTYREGLKRYALFTLEKTREALKQKREAEVSSRLYQNALNIGEMLRKDFRVNTLEKAMRISRIVYKILDIELQGNNRGEIKIRRCYFSSYYSGEVCRFISALDAGLLAGLSGGGRLDFQQRITEGGSCCTATLSLPKRSK